MADDEFWIKGVPKPVQVFFVVVGFIALLWSFGVIH